MKRKKKITKQTKVTATDLIGSGAEMQTGGVRGSGGRLLGSCEVRGVMRALPQDIEEPGRLLRGSKEEGRTSTKTLPHSATSHFIHG